MVLKISFYRFESGGEYILYFLGRGQVGKAIVFDTMMHRFDPYRPKSFENFDKFSANKCVFCMLMWWNGRHNNLKNYRLMVQVHS